MIIDYDEGREGHPLGWRVLDLSWHEKSAILTRISDSA